MAIYKYPIYKIRIDHTSKKQQGLSVGDIVRRQYMADENQLLYSLMVVLDTGTDVVIDKDNKEQKSPYFIGGLLEGDEPQNGELLDFVRTTSLFNPERTGALYLTASDDQSPFMDVIDQTPSESSFFYPTSAGGKADTPSFSKYACMGEEYLLAEYVSTIADSSRIYKLTRNTVDLSSGKKIGIKQTLTKQFAQGQVALVSFKVRSSKNYKDVPYSLGFADNSHSDGSGKIDITTDWTYKVISISIDYPQQKDRSFLLDLTGFLNKGEWIEVADMNILPLSSVANFSKASKIRVGKLKGIVDPLFGLLDGYGAYFQNVFATKNINIAGTLTAADQNGSASTFYVGKIYKNAFLNSLTCSFTPSVEKSKLESPTGVGDVYHLTSPVSLLVQTKEWCKKHEGERYCFSFWAKSDIDSFLQLSINGAALEDGLSVSGNGTWERQHVSFDIPNTDKDLVIQISSGDFYFSSPQLEYGDTPTLYQPTDAKLNETDQYGAWFSRGGIGGTIQNPLLKLNEDGSISSNNDSFVIKNDGSGYFSNGAIRWNEKEVTLGENVKLKWDNLDEDSKENLKGTPGKDGEPGKTGEPGKNGEAGKDAISVHSSQPTMVLLCDDNGKTVEKNTVTTKITALKGNTAVALSIGTIPTVTGMSIVKNDSSKTIIFTVEAQNTSLSERGNIEIPVTVDGKSFVITFSWTKVNQGTAGNDAYSVHSSQTNLVLQADSEGTVLKAQSVVSKITAYKGVISKAFTVGTIPAVTGMTITKNETQKTITFSVAASNKTLADSGNIEIPIVVDGMTFTIPFSWAKSKNGTSGKDANMLDWVEDWNTGKTVIDANTIITPKIFAGSKDSDGSLSGVAIGNYSIKTKNAAGSFVSTLVNGIYGLKNGYRTFSLDETGGVIAGWSIDSDSIYRGTKKNAAGSFTASTGSVTIGNYGIRGYRWFFDASGNAQLGTGTQFIKYNSSSGKIEFGSEVTLNWTEAIDSAKDEAITTAAEDASTKAEKAKSDAVSSAASDATTKANSALTSSKTYADTKKTEAINAASTDATTKSNNALSSAKTYADTKKTEAIDSAKSNTTTQINALKTQLESSISEAKKAGDNAQVTADAITKKSQDEKWHERLTHISSTGIFTGTLDAVVVNALRLNASQITAGTIDAARINVSALKASLITTENIEALELNTTKGKVGGWTIDSDSIYRGTKSNTAGSFTSASGSITIGSNGIRGNKWRLDSTGAGSIAGGNITWDASGNVNFSSAVSLNWASAAAYGRMMFRDPEFFTGNNSINVYDNSKNGNVTVTRTSDNTAPNQSKYVLVIKNVGASSPACGGFSWAHAASEGKIYVTRIIAKIPVGRDLAFATNSLGTGGGHNWLTPVSGTGKWSEYIIKILVGADPSSTNFFYITGAVGTAVAPVEWRVAYASVFDTTSSEKYTTTIDANGIYTGTLTANQINSLSLTVNKGSVGGWGIGEDYISSGSSTSAGSSDAAIQIRTTSTGSGYWYTNAYKPKGISLTWHQTSNAGHITFGQIAASGNTVKTGFYGIQMMSWDHLEYFCLSANTLKVGSKEIYNRIAGWGFDNDSLFRGTKNNSSGAFTGASDWMTIGTTGIRGFKWRLDSNGAGSLAGGNISWDATGKVTFGSDVSLNWTAPLDNLQIGGNNLFNNSGDWRTAAWNGGVTTNGGGYTIDSSVLFNGKPTLKTLVGAGLYHNWIKLENGVEYTYSAMVRCNETITGNGSTPLHYHAGLNNANEGKISIIKYDTSVTGNTWKRIYIVFKLTGNADSFRAYFYRGNNGTTTYWLAYLKLEKGNKPTDWSPSASDLQKLSSDAQTTANGVVTALGGSNYPKLTQISSTGIYTGTLTASQINALTLTVNKGTVGAWNIGTDNISTGSLNVVGQNPIQIRTSTIGSGHVYNGSLKPYGITLSWYQSNNAGSIILGQVLASGTTVKNGFMGLQMMAWDNTEYFCISANTTKSGSKEVYNRIAGWGFDNQKIWKNNVSLGADGSITNSTKWKLNNDGSGQLANGNISWTAAGDVTFGSSVSLNWTNAANNALASAKTYADTKKSEAVSTAASDATTKANAAKELAQAMAFGKMLYRYPEFFHNGSIHYNGTNNYCSNATRSIVQYAGTPNSTGYALRYVATNWHTATDLRVGGFSFGNLSRANAQFLVRIIANIPVGRSIQNYHNAYGTGQTQKWLTPQAGTGKWEEYLCLVKCGTSGTFSTVNHFALTGGAAPTAAAPVTWYIAYATVFDITAAEKYTTTIDANGVYTSTIKANQIQIDSALVVGGSTYNGSISVRDAANAVKVTLDRTGITAVAGKIGGWTISSSQISTGNVVLGSDGTIKNSTYWILNKDGSGQLANGNISWTTAGVATIKNVTATGLNATSGKIGGFEIASGRIGSTASGTGSGGGLAIYSDLFRVGSTTSYALLGHNTFPASAGAGYCTGRLTNNVSNAYGRNYGLYCDVTGGQRNFGVYSNAALSAPYMITNKAKLITFGSGTYTIDFSQNNLFFFYGTQNCSVTLPTEASVRTMFGLSALPSDFAILITFVYAYNRGYRVTFNGIYNNDGNLINHNMEKGDTLTLLCSKYPSFHYQLLMRMY